MQSSKSLLLCHSSPTLVLLIKSRFDSIDGRQARWVDANKQCINDITKNCPRCKSAIEKNGGCNHVTCLICKFEFCWPCLLEWNRNCQDDHWFED
ncbi:E3 ubiquitin-protein ligase parkin-like [Dysidea avara]|uniref:E3 ubiquitin-protein ligase parkin-like n=1 Tax=Dysidea avara TaxID=196820 RepID=UPI00331A4D91